MSIYPGDMRNVGFGFREAWRAEAAATELRAMLDLGERDLSVAEVGGDARSLGGHRVVLGGRIREPRLSEAIDVVERYGGSVLTDVQEAWI